MEDLAHDNKKYYTPVVEEFYVGFEYEYLTVDSKWIKDTFMSIKPEDTEQMDFSTIESILKKCPTELRVKYLDKEDILSLAWEQGKLPYQFFDGIHMLVVLDHHRISITHTADDQCLFYGEIKNKSELRILMKQLGI